MFARLKSITNKHTFELIAPSLGVKLETKIPDLLLVHFVWLKSINFWTKTDIFHQKVKVSDKHTMLLCMQV
jgi:hypothetical protein